MTNNNNDIDHIEAPLPFSVTEGINSKNYNIYISEEIIEAEHYNKLFTLFRGVGEYDIIRLYINSPGGNLFTGVQLINAMRGSAAHIITILDGMAFSLAPLILFAGDEIVINDNAMIMFHNYSSWGGGKGNEQLANSQAMNDFYRNMLHKYGEPFLDGEEIKQILDGKDLYFGYDEISDRVKIIMSEYDFDEDEIEMVDIIDEDDSVINTDDFDDMDQLELDLDNTNA